jgi:4-oxalomesaconate tautomerase
MLMRGGTSKGAYLLATDVPADPAARDDLLLRLLGSPDHRQIDGIGGGHPLTSKVAVVSPAADPTADVDYLFLQVQVDAARVSAGQPCGNILAGVGPFAVERGLVKPSGAGTTVRIRMVNTGGLAVATFPTTPHGVEYAGDTLISGVPFPAAEVVITFSDTEGAVCGSLLPTGRALDHVDGTAVTCVDNGMPVVVVAAADLGVTGHETCAELEADERLRARLEVLRLRAGDLMGLGDVRQDTVPKMTLVAPPREGGTLATRTFIPHRCHTSIGVLGAVTVATAAALPGSVAHTLAVAPAETPSGSGAVSRCRLEHPSGFFDTEVVRDATGRVDRVGVVRTARKLFDGVAWPRPAEGASRVH